MRTRFLCALVFVGFSVSANAADLAADINSVKDPIPDNLTFHGVTVYGTIDLGFAYQTHGTPLSGAYAGGLEYNLFGSKNANRSIATAAESGLEASKIGVKIEENLGYGWAAIGKLETDFNPLSGELDDGPGSLIRANGVPLRNQATAVDSSRAGQAFSGPAYAGVTNATYGTLTVGRQQSLQLDALSEYDPMGLSFAFSLLGYSGTPGGGGDTEAARWDNSVKYIYQYGPFHAAAMYSNGGSDTGILGDAYGFDVGGSYRGFSLDAVYSKEKSVISASALGSCQGLPNGLSCSNSLAGTISDNDVWSVEGKYTFNIGGAGYKDMGPAAKLTFYGGYEHIQQGNPSDPAVLGNTTAGGYVLASVNNTNFDTDKVLQVTWTGAKYELPSGWSFTGAYYHVDQNSFLTGTTPTACTKGASNCSGTFNQASFLVDYQINKHFDVYGGVSYMDVAGGEAAGFLNDNMTTVVTGARLKF